MLNDLTDSLIRLVIAYCFVRSVQLGVVDRGLEHRMKAAIYLFFALSFLGVIP